MHEEHVPVRVSIPLARTFPSAEIVVRQWPNNALPTEYYRIVVSGVQVPRGFVGV